jgi:asparagine synthase (glutamine-hydrolysing)
MTFPDINPQIDHQALSQVFTYWTALPPKTIFENILELPPGHFMKISEKETSVKRFWTLKFPVSNEGYFQGTIKDASEQLTELLTDAVKIRLRADVPVAAYLSGGIDSSATTSLIKSIAPKQLETYSIGFEEAEFDETPFQEEVADYLATKHSAFRCTSEEIGSVFPSVVWHAEIPLLRTAPAPMYILSKAVHERNIKVVITGEGADEMLAGYDIFKEALIREFWARYPDSKLRPALFNKLYPYLSQFQGRNNTMLKYFYGYKLNEVNSPFYSHVVRWNNTAKIQHYFSSEIAGNQKEPDHGAAISEMLPKDFERYDLLSKAQWLESFIFMTGYLLSSQGDRVAMANSVEGRYPFLDYRVMEFCATLPGSFKLHGLNEKFILKKMMDKKLPEKVLKRSKQAYRAPMASSFFSKSASEYVNDLLSEKGIKNTGLFNYDLVERLLQKTRAGTLVTEIENMALSGIISTQLLYHQFIIGDSYRPSFPVLENCRMVYENEHN